MVIACIISSRKYHENLWCKHFWDIPVFHVISCDVIIIHTRVTGTALLLFNKN